MGFQQQSVWIKSSFALITIGFVVWLSAGDTVVIGYTDMSRYNAYVAFMIIGIITYYGAVLLNFLYIFVPDTEGNAIVLLVGAILGILAGISGMITSGIVSFVPFSDRIAWALICALISAAFLLVTFICGGGGGRLGGGGGAGGVSSGIGGGGAKSSSEAHTAEFQPHQQVPA